MNENPHEVFRSREDYYNWDRYIEQCDRIRGLSDTQKEQLRYSFNHLRNALGEGFLKHAIDEGHPLVPLLMNSAAWCRIKIIGLSEALEALEGAENFNRVLKRIRARPGKKTRHEIRRQSMADQFLDGYSVLHTAYQFHKAGFRVGFVDERGSDKKSDIKLIDEETGQDLFVEVSALNHSKAIANAQRASEPIWDFFFSLEPFDLIMCAELQSGFDGRQASEAVKKLQALRDKVKATGVLSEMINDFIVAAIAPANKEDQLLYWAETKGLSPGITGPPLFLNELSRVMRKARDKFSQLPSGKPGLLAIPTPQSLLFFFTTQTKSLSVLNL